jgi:metal-dependent amidase/aminoacylase/carboxypeptidase family protein
MTILQTSARRRHVARLLLAAAIIGAPYGRLVANAQAPAVNRLDGRLVEFLSAREASLVAFRRDLHRHPELSNMEVRTAGAIADRLRAAGLTVRTGVGGHGVVATLKGASAGPLVAYRADMDAVRSADPDPVDFRSETAGVRHICGHDIHVTVAVALAEALAHVRADLRGSIVFIFQPAEERATGAEAMLRDDVFAGGMPVAIYGLHVGPFAAGHVAVKPDVMMLPNDAAPGAINDPSLTAAAVAAITRVVGAASVTALTTPPPGFSEDFGHFQRVVPGVFFFLGASNSAAGTVSMPHSGDFVADESAIVPGARAMAAVLLDRLAAGGR